MNAVVNTVSRRTGSAFIMPQERLEYIYEYISIAAIIPAKMDISAMFCPSRTTLVLTLTV